jgi:hypothetical protein
MLASINPLGERGRNQRFPITVTAFFVGSIGAAAALGAVLGRLGSPFATRDRAFVAIGILAVVGLALDRTRRVPGPRRQVDQRWLTAYRGWVYGLGFGAQLGLAFTTIVSASAIYVAFACAFLSGSALGGALIGATFGLVRALPLLTTARVRTPSELRSVIVGLERLRPPVATLTSVTQLVAVGCLVVAA